MAALLLCVAVGMFERRLERPPRPVRLGDVDASVSPSRHPSTVDAIATIPVGGEPIGITGGFGSVWVVNSEFQSGGKPSVSRIDPATNAVTATIPVGEVPLETIAGFGSIWVSNSESDTVSRIDPETDAVDGDDRSVRRAGGVRDRGRIGVGRLRERRTGGDHRSRE